MEDYTNVWFNSVCNMSKLTNYRSLQDKIKPATHLKCNLSKDQRAMISQLRNGCLPLEIELGRYQGLPVLERHCKLCKTGDTESELHFLFRCKELEEQRLAMYHKLPEILSFAEDIDKLKYLCEHPYIMGNFIVKMWQHRELKLLVVCNNPM